jgi:UDP:flavonoid glycosyltransferase YjiC (YdhE family)
LSAERLASALRVMVTDTTMRARAAELGAALRTEDGIGAAVTLIRQYAGAPKI